MFFQIVKVILNIKKKNMTREEKLQAVTADIRKKLPRLMKLEKGCLIQSHHFKDVREIFKVKELYLKESDTYETAYFSNCDQFTIEVTFERDIQKNIGKEPLLNDVLEWLIKKIINDSNTAIVFDKNINGYLGIGIRKTSPAMYRGFCTNWANWDLSKSLLKDQSEDVIEFLFNYIRN